MRQGGWRTGVAGCALGLLLPGMAAGAPSWPQAPQTLSAGGQNAEAPQVAMNARGEALAVWHRPEPGYDLRVQAAWRTGGGYFGPPEGVSTGRFGRHPDTGVDGAGGAIAMWDGVEGPTSASTAGIRAAFRPASGPFGPPVSVFEVSTDPTFGTATSPAEMAINEAGDAVAAWVDYDGSDYRLFAAVRPAGGAFQAAQSIPLNNPGFGPAPDVAIDAAGNAIVVFVDNASEYPALAIRAAYRPAGGSFAAPVTASPLSTAGALAPSVAMDAAGNATVAWVRLTGTNLNRIAAAVRPPGAGQAFAPEQDLSDAAGEDDNPVVAVDASGDAAVVWRRRDDGTGTSIWRVEAAYRRAGESFGPPQTLSQTWTGNWPDAPGIPDVDIDARGGALAVWSRETGGDRAIETSYRGPADAAFGAVVPISDAGEDPGRARVATDDRGNAAVVWEGFDGGNTVIRARLGVAPPDPASPTPDPPLPPPPPPPPPDATAIRLAEKMEPNRPVVLIAEVSGPVSRLEWSVPGTSVSRPVVGENVNGALQRSVRFRVEPGKDFRVRLRAVGPGGSEEFERTFRAPRARADADVERVVRAIERANASPVFAVGDPAVLTGRSASCDIPTSLRGGTLEVTGCLQPIESLADIPAAERGILDPLAMELGLDRARAELMRTAVEMTDGFKTQAQLALNDKWPVVPGPGASILALPQAKALTSSDAGFDVGGFRIKQPDGFKLSLDPRKAAQGIDLGAVPRPPSLPSIGGFKLVGDFKIDLERREARITAHVKLPSFLKKAGIEIQNEVKFRATPDRLILDELTIGPINVHVGALAVDAFQIRYTVAGDEWQGQGKACVVGSFCLDMVPPNGQVKIKSGRLDFAGASLVFPTPGLPLFSGVNLERIGFGFGLNPTRFTGNARLAFAQVLVIDGRIVVAFPSQQEPFFLKRDEVGSDFPDRFYGYRFTGTTIGLSAAAALRLPAVGELPLARAYVLYEFPGYLALGGSMNYAIREPIGNVALISVDGKLDGEFNAGNGRFNIDGHVRACVVDILCRGVDGNVSSNGMSVCTAVDTWVHEFHMGGAIRWSPFKFIPYLDGCKWGRFREPNVRGRMAQAGAAHSVEIEAGDPSRTVMLEGAAGAPLVQVVGPAGDVLLESPAGSALAATDDTRIRIMRSEAARFVAVGFAGAPAGRYEIRLADGSAAVSEITEASALPDARASARVTGRGARRVLSWRVGARPHQKVSFFEVGNEGTGRQIGPVSDQTAGRVVFSPAPGTGTSRIEARFELDGVPAESEVVARFTPPPPRLAAPRGLRVRRAGRGLRVRWRRVPEATRYEVAVTTTAGLQRFAVSRSARATFRRVPRTAAGRVTVRPVDRYRQGPPAARRFVRAARPHRALQPLGHCRVGRRVVCRG